MHFHPDRHYRITGFAQNIHPDWQHKLLALGLLPGAYITVERLAPLGDPVQIRIGHSRLMLRQKDLTQLSLDPTEPD